jgi:hypothetical protein
METDQYWEKELAMLAFMVISPCGRILVILYRQFTQPLKIITAIAIRLTIPAVISRNRRNVLSPLRMRKYRHTAIITKKTKAVHKSEQIWPVDMLYLSHILLRGRRLQVVPSSA